ncbi:MAG: site-2 protease family protein [Clostridia bacterium]|nr:site-2 protease family protein [Clostridia bacterium]
MIQYFLNNRGHMTVQDLFFLVLSYTVIVLVNLPFHEFAHAWVAHKCGDDTARWNGRLTLNPLKHLDPLGTALIVLCGFGYARPVPVITRNFRNYKRDMILVALAGPLSNLLLAAVSVGLFALSLTFVREYQTLLWLKMIFIDILMSVNITLAVFNMLPIPPLDGSRLWSTLLPPRVAYALERNSRVFTIVLFALLVVGVLDGPLYWLSDGIARLLFTVFGLN